ncbi:lipopolysaccharide biosynthesis protein [Pelagicoccus enzymogenes]|uniref:lipopolysaccharide biosynthesis protein n=1 Tax=Pelagicoccus enzymogenes TaxID=2773457 RepID=UPI00280D636E|nr:lipopolysaccharide biosynthesis protein [Pelagicoccus enzymogenes]MDQ8198900.1 lipopolysaccharide biosynthesis protein [Pelagicoccus enzymogenes]
MRRRDAKADLLFETKHLEDDLKKKAVRGGSFTASSQAINMLLRLLSTAVLARLLTPEDYGLIGMTLVVTGLARVLGDGGGFLYATLQKKTLSHEEVSLLFWVNLAIGLTVAIALIVVSPVISMVFDESRLTPLLCLLSLSFFFGGLSVQHKALLRRQMMFGKISVVDIGSTCVGLGIGIGMAYQGFGYWSLAGMEIGIALSSTLLTWAFMRWVPSRPRRVEGMDSTWKFGGNIFLFNLVNYFTRNADNALIGWYWGASALGLYSRAYSLLMLPIRNMNAPFSAVAIPTLSRAAANPAKLKKFFLGAVSMVSALSIPVVVGATAFAEDLVLLWLGENWMATADIFRILSIPAFLFGATQPLAWLFVVMDRTSVMRNIGFVAAPVNVAAFAIGLPYGPEGVAIGYTISSCLMFFPLALLALKGSGVSLWEVLKSWKEPLVSSVPGVLLGYLIKEWGGGSNPIVIAFLSLGVFALSYVLVMTLFFGWVDRVKSWYSLKQGKGEGVETNQSRVSV